MSVDRATVRHVASLARLRLDDAREQEFAAQLGDILTYVDLLERLPAGDDSVGSAASAPLRDDVAVPSHHAETLRAGFPDRVDDRIRVPKVLGGDE